MNIKYTKPNECKKFLTEGMDEKARKGVEQNGRWYCMHTIHHEKSTIYSKKHEILTKKHLYLNSVFYRLNSSEKYIIPIKRIFGQNHLKSLLQATFIKTSTTLIF